MFHSLKAAVVFSSALFFGAFLGSASSISPAHADTLQSLPSPSLQPVKQGPPPPHDPTKKNAGEACKSSDECQKHHTCAKVDDQMVCKAPPRRQLPPGAVT